MGVNCLIKVLGCCCLFISDLTISSHSHWWGKAFYPIIFLFTHWLWPALCSFLCQLLGSLGLTTFSFHSVQALSVNCYTYMPTHSPFPYETEKLIHTSQDCSEDEISLGLPWWTPNVSAVIIFLINLFKTFFLSLFIRPSHMNCRISVAWPGIEPGPLAMEAWSPNPWTTKEFSNDHFTLKSKSLFITFHSSWLLCTTAHLLLEMSSSYNMVFLKAQS